MPLQKSNDPDNLAKVDYWTPLLSLRPPGHGFIGTQPKRMIRGSGLEA
jgi:hypothetical protein